MRDTTTPHSIINQQSIDRIKQVTWDAHPLTQDRKESFLRKYACNEHSRPNLGKQIFGMSTHLVTRQQRIF